MKMCTRISFFNPLFLVGLHAQSTHILLEEQRHKRCGPNSTARIFLSGWLYISAGRRRIRAHGGRGPPQNRVLSSVAYHLIWRLAAGRLHVFGARVVQGGCRQWGGCRDSDASLHFPEALIAFVSEHPSFINKAGSECDFFVCAAAVRLILPAATDTAKKAHCGVAGDRCGGIVYFISAAARALDLAAESSVG